MRGPRGQVAVARAVKIIVRNSLERLEVCKRTTSKLDQIRSSNIVLIRQRRQLLGKRRKAGIIRASVLLSQDNGAITAAGEAVVEGKTDGRTRIIAAHGTVQEPTLQLRGDICPDSRARALALNEREKVIAQIRGLALQHRSGRGDVGEGESLDTGRGREKKDGGLGEVHYDSM